MRRYVSTETDYTLDTRPERPGKRGILLERTKTIKAGDYLECEIFPMVLMEPGIREARRKRTPEQMREINRRNAVKKLERLMNANFTAGDLMPHLTMDRPCSFEEMQKIVRNFFQRLRRLAAKRGAVLRYIYVIETKQEHGQQRHHLHGIISARPAQGPSAQLPHAAGARLSCACGPSAENLITRDEIEKLWGHGLARVDRVQQQEKGLTGFARYITQQKTTQERLMRRSWGASKGLRQPTVTVADHKFSRAAAAKIARDLEGDARTILEKKYPGYRLIEQPVIRYSDWLPGAYIYAFMQRDEAVKGKELQTG